MITQGCAARANLEVSDAEWRIKCIEHISDGGELLTYQGLPELVCGREEIFLPENEPSIHVLAPDDTSRTYRANNFYLATLLAARFDTLIMLSAKPEILPAWSTRCI